MKSRKETFYFKVRHISRNIILFSLLSPSIWDRILLNLLMINDMIVYKLNFFKET